MTSQQLAAAVCPHTTGTADTLELRDSMLRCHCRKSTRTLCGRMGKTQIIGLSMPPWSLPARAWTPLTSEFACPLHAIPLGGGASTHVPAHPSMTISVCTQAGPVLCIPQRKAGCKPLRACVDLDNK